MSTALPITAPSEAGQTLLDTLRSMAKKTCYVDWIVGSVFGYLYVAQSFFGGMSTEAVLKIIGVWPLVALFAISRGCDTLKAFGGKWIDQPAAKRG